MIHEAKRRGALTELSESDAIKNRYVESKKSDLEVFKDWLLLEVNSDGWRYECIEHWLLGDGYMREMQEKIAKKGEYNNKTTDDVWEKYLEFIADGGGDTVHSTRAVILW